MTITEEGSTLLDDCPPVITITQTVYCGLHKFKVAQVSPLLNSKKPNLTGLDTELLSNYRPVSNLAFL